MRWFIRPLLVAGCPSLVFAAPAALDREPPAEFYVASRGADVWSGTRAQPDADNTDGPFATLARARDAVRCLRASGTPDRPVTVLIRGGEYRLTEPFVLRPEDSGTPGGPVTYRAYPGERPVFSGGRRLVGWRRGEDGLWSVEVPEARGGSDSVRQLFVNGQRSERARWRREKWFTVAGAAQPREAGWRPQAAIEGSKCGTLWMGRSCTLSEGLPDLLMVGWPLALTGMGWPHQVKVSR